MPTKKNKEDAIVETPAENTEAADASTPAEGGSVIESVLTTVAETIGKTAAEKAKIISLAQSEVQALAAEAQRPCARLSQAERAGQLLAAASLSRGRGNSADRRG